MSDDIEFANGDNNHSRDKGKWLPFGSLARSEENNKKYKLPEFEHSRNNAKMNVRVGNTDLSNALMSYIGSLLVLSQIEEFQKKHRTAKRVKIVGVKNGILDIQPITK